MNWIKKNYDRFALLLLAVALLASSIAIVLRSKKLPELFASIQAKVPPGDQIKPAEVSMVEAAIEAISKPPAWQAHPGSLFVSRKYLVQGGKLVDPLEGDFVIHPPVPNDWLLSHGFDLLDANVLSDDSDGDGFSVLDEYIGKSDPQNKDSRPPYYTKLRLKQYLRKRFRLKFAAYDGDSYQINTLDVRQPSQFLKLGDPIKGTKFKVLKFEKKKVLNPSTQIDEDVSELTIQNEENQEMVTLILDKIVDSPDSYALFTFLLDGSEFNVKKDQKFSLKIEPNVEYKLIDIQPNEAVITNLKTDERIKIPRVEAAVR